MSTLATMRTKLSRALRDESATTFDSNTLNDLINQGIAALSRFYPREAVDTIALSVSVASYTTNVAFTKIYRIDRYNSAGSYVDTIPSNSGDGPNSGWELHNAIVWFPPNRVWSSGDSVKMFGYASYAQLTADDDATTFDVTGEWAVIVFGQMEGYGRLLDGRASFQQWQASPQNRDTTALSLAQIYSGAQRRWDEEVRALRRMRKVS